MRFTGRGYILGLAGVAGLAVASLAGLQKTSAPDYGGLSVLTPAGPAEPPPDVFRGLPRLVHARHRILKGENIRAIASDYGTDIRSLQSTNNNEFIVPPSRGGYIRVHNGKGFLYEVTADGETLNGLVARFRPKVYTPDEFKTAVIRENRLPGVAMLCNYRFRKGDRVHLPTVYLNLDTYHLPLPYYSRISSNFGFRYHPVLKRKIFHKGCDIPMPLNTPVFASRSGVVTFAGWKEGFGYIVEMRHSDGSVTRYGHLAKVSVSVGETVQKSRNVIGRVGSSGMSTGPHLHFEIITPGGRSVNPFNKLGRR